jgi:trimeric autotransporter adhesin
MHSIPRSPDPFIHWSFRGCAGGVFAVLLMIAVGRPAFAQQASTVNQARVTQVVDDSVLTTLKGNVHPLAKAKYDEGPANPSLSAERMQLVLQRSPGQEIALRQFLGSLQDTNSGRYRKWLTPAQFGAQYGVSDADIQTVSTWLESEGFRVDKINKAHTIIEFSGTVGQIQSAFHTQIHSFTVNGEQHLANVTDPQIPAALSPVVAGLSSLNNFFAKPQHTKPLPGKYDQATSKFVPNFTLGSGTADEPYFLFVGPGDAATIYDSPNAWNTKFSGTTSYTGTGVSIGIVGDSNIATSDVADYRSLFGLPAATPTVVVDGNDPGVNGDVVEALLDLETSGGLAPGATQTFYTAADTNLDSGLFLAINRALDDNNVGILSVSFGGCEAFQGATGNQLINALWEQAASQGITVTVSAGDNGSAGCDDFDTQQAAQDGLQVNGIASTPFNIAVGGTDFNFTEADFTTYVSATNTANLTSALGYIPELPGNGSTSVNGSLSANVPFMDFVGDTNILAASGGASSCILPQYDANGNVTACLPVTGAITGYAKPSWQTGGTLNLPADGVRDLPDLSLFAAFGSVVGPEPAAWLVCYATTIGGTLYSCANGTSNPDFAFYGVGGTSASSPAFAGMLALISQSQGGARLGQANYVLYNLANQASLYGSAFHDVITGNNSVYCYSGSPDCGSNLFESGYNAGVAYDQASGLGSVDIAQLVADWNMATFTPSTTTLTINGGTAPVSITHGQAVTLSATVAGAGGTPTGDVAILSNANEQANTYNSNWLTTVTLAGGTTGPQNFTGLPGGTYIIAANYGGDITFAQSQSTPGIQVTVAKENSVVELFGANSTGKSLTISGSYPYGTAFSLDAQPFGVSQVGAANPVPATGTVTFADTAGALPGSSAGAAAGVVAINSFGYAELPVYYWTTAAHSVSASYSGDNSLNASTATPAAFTITQATTANTVTSSTASIGSGTFTVTSLITPTPLSMATAPTGTVTLTLNGTTIGTGKVSAAQEPNTGASLAAVAISVKASALTAGANTITATYSGDTNYAGSTGTVAVNSVAGLAIAGSSIATITAGGSGTSTITVTPSAGFTGAVSLSCSVGGGPMGAVSVPTCSLNPTSVTIAGTTAATSTLTIATTAATTGGSYTATIVAADTATGTVTANNTVAVTVSFLDLASTAATVASPGQTGTSTITITPNNYTGTIGLGCVLVSQPSGANGVNNPTCTVSPNKVSITSSAAVTTTATIATTAPGNSAALVYPRTNRWSMAAGGAALACILFFGIPARRRGWRSMLGLLVLISAMAGIGCGGGVVIPPNNPSVPGTSPGVYTFSVTATDTTTSTTTGSTVFTVTVQ